MANSRSFFSQLLQWILQQEFQKGVDQYEGDKKVRKFPCWSQFVELLFGQLTGHSSLRAIEARLRGVPILARVNSHSSQSDWTVVN